MKLKLILLAVVAVFSLTACSTGSTTSNSGDADLKSKISALEKEIATLKKENEQLKGQSNSTESDSGTEASAKSDDSTAESSDNSLTLTKGTALTIDDFTEITITKTKYAKKVTPSSPGSFYTYYEAKGEDTTYLVITAKVKNLQDSAQTADDLVTGKVKYDNKYEYSFFTVIEENDGSEFNYSNITPIKPLSANTVLFLTEIPKEVETSDKSLIAEFNLNGDTYQYKVR
ncbi:hypothetical protein D3C76_709660 [compost metagenome]